jgi:hypothetical protein
MQKNTSYLRVREPSERSIRRLAVHVVDLDGLRPPLSRNDSPARIDGFGGYVPAAMFTVYRPSSGPKGSSSGQASTETVVVSDQWSVRRTAL